MTFHGINYLGVFVAAVTSFVFGAFYYMALAKPWTAALDKPEAEIRLNRSRTSYSITAFAELVMAYMIAGLLGHLGPITTENGVISAAFLWFGFVVPTMAVNYRYQRQNKTLFWFDAIHWLGVLLIQGALIGTFGVRPPRPVSELMGAVFG